MFWELLKLGGGTRGTRPGEPVSAPGTVLLGTASSARLAESEAGCQAKRHAGSWIGVAHNIFILVHPTKAYMVCKKVD